MKRIVGRAVFVAFSMSLGIKGRAQITMKRLENEAAYDIGNFNCLPEDVLMSILNRILDLKCLFQCTLVSKDFASKIHRIKSISLKLPEFDFDPNEASTNAGHLSSEMLRVEPRKISELQEFKFITFLRKFTELESASFESTFSRTFFSVPSLKWTAKLGNRGPAVQMLVLALPAPISAEAEYESDEDGYDYGEDEDGDDYEEDEDEEDEDEQDEQEALTFHQYLQEPMKRNFLSSFMWFANLFVLVFSLIEQHHSLKSVMCTDPDKHGKIVLNDVRIVEWRKRLLSGDLWYDVSPRTVSVGWIPSSDLPLQWCQMKDSCFWIMNFLPGNHHDIMKSWEHDEEEEVLADLINGLTGRQIRELCRIHL